MFKYSPYSYIQSDARNYDRYVMYYLRKNKNKTVYDFLVEKIKETEDVLSSIIEYTDTEYKEKLYKEVPEKYSIEDRKRWVHNEFYIYKNKRSLPLKPNLEFLKLKLQTIPKPQKIKTTKSLLLQGKQLNLVERYTIANNVLGIDNKIRTLNISDTEKYKLLGYILGCNETNARHIMNGQYKGKIKEKLLKEYISTLNK